MDHYHRVDIHGDPAGGRTMGVGIRIDWQDGVLGRGESRRLPTGAVVEDVIRAALRRLEFYQKTSGGKFSCRQNALAIIKLAEAIFWLDDRTAEREDRGVEGTYTP